jgi:hypothetical protein
LVINSDFDTLVQTICQHGYPLKIPDFLEQYGEVENYKGFLEVLQQNGLTHLPLVKQIQIPTNSLAVLASEVTEDFARLLIKELYPEIKETYGIKVDIECTFDPAFVGFLDPQNYTQLADFQNSVMMLESLYSPPSLNKLALLGLIGKSVLTTRFFKGSVKLSKRYFKKPLDQKSTEDKILTQIQNFRNQTTNLKMLAFYFSMEQKLIELESKYDRSRR